MRIRALVLAGAIAATSLFALATPAGAAESKPGELFECLEKAVTDNAPEGATREELEALPDSTKSKIDTAAQQCYSAPNPIVPALSEIIWGGLAFLVVAFALMKFGWPQLKATLRTRQETIQRDLEAAEQAKADADAARAEYESKIAEARTEATRIVEEARQTAEGVRAETVRRAEEEANAIRARAAEDAQAAASRAMTDLQSQVGSISVELAEKIVERNLDAATQQQLIESFISQVGRNSN